MEKKLILIDDDATFLKITSLFLSNQNWQIEAFESWTEAKPVYESDSFPIMMIDLNIGNQNGLQIIEEIKKKKPNQAIVVVTGHSSIETAVSALRMGVSDYLVKPFEHEEILIRLDNIYSIIMKDIQIADLKGQIASSTSSKMDFITQNNGLEKLMKIVRTVSSTDATILLQGETGTGKEVFAKLIHEESNRASELFTVVNCAGLNENLLESHLFGHVKGAFTGAHEAVKGKFEVVGEGTIFLDEISETSLNFQKKLLRVLQEKTFERIGESKPRICHARVIAATNRNLGEMVRDGTFREDLFFRLNVVPILIPPLRQRMGDIPLLAKYFIQKYSQKYKKEIRDYSEDFFNQLEKHDWPGNVRELEHYIEKLVITAIDGKLTTQMFPLSKSKKVVEVDHDENWSHLDFEGFTRESERLYFQSLLDSYQGDVAKASKHAKTAKKTIYAKIKKYNLNLSRN